MKMMLDSENEKNESTVQTRLAMATVQGISRTNRPKWKLCSSVCARHMKKHRRT
ncbi:UNVERIFIED_CONTAM: hypothetical protein FKN15_034828 [Acipenser sinensis]